MTYIGGMGSEMVHAVPDDAVEVTSTELRDRLRDFLERVAFGEDELVVTRAGKPMAAMISMDAYVVLRKCITMHADVSDAAAARSAQKLNEYVSLEDFIKGSEDGP
jgi:prevent-host-death family protein